ncbi:histidine phosphatase family protein [Actinocrispum wychmicini]|uniref:Putative phosphoglycerate mutase n=1 Tax=Actinocrispum wychmicini TaxID=1213861 RepID=A0A4R2K709_9PSEU|nr:histidine phosphatase family protein [Actinocrispum wychmicini]TCO65729.1 putative phosphoglycerate mutase [Actinocrispum wychmicini]
MTVETDAKVYLLRHGETEWSLAGQHTGLTDVPLTDNGEQQARRAGLVISALRGTAVPPYRVYTSPRKRAIRTAELAGLEVDDTLDELAEWNYGDYEGLTTEQIRETAPGWTVWTQQIPGGEDVKEVSDRADTILDKVRKVLPCGDVVLVGHGHFTRALIARWLNLPVDQGVHFGLDAAGTTVLDHERGEPRVGRLNIPPLDL